MFYNEHHSFRKASAHSGRRASAHSEPYQVTNLPSPICANFLAGANLDNEGPTVLRQRGSSCAFQANHGGPFWTKLPRKLRETDSAQTAALAA
jgi:hypothetical protein